MLNIVLDMETQDPDDFLTLLLLLGHPRVQLRAVTVTPGSRHQVGVVRHALRLFQRDVPVGAYNLDHPKCCVSSWHYRAYGEIPPSAEAEPGHEVLRRVCDEDTVLVTGAPLKNLGAALDHPDFRLGRWVAQGGFAGEGVVPPERQLAKFRGRRTCPTFNLNGDPRSALRALADERIRSRSFVSKNVCHGVIYDEPLHARLAPLCEASRSLALIWKGMEVYLGKHRASRSWPPVNEEIDDPEVLVIDPEGTRLGVLSISAALAEARRRGLDLVLVAEAADGRPATCRIRPRPTLEEEEPLGKKLHDPLAACCAIAPEIATWAEVEIYRERGEWGARLHPGSNTVIITDLDRGRFLDVLTEHEAYATR